MKPQTMEDVLELLDGYVASAALGAAMELGVFWLLAEKPLSTQSVAESLQTPGTVVISGYSYSVSLVYSRKAPKVTPPLSSLERLS